MIEYTLGENEYGKYAVPTNTLDIETLSRMVVAGEVYEPNTTRFILENCGTGSIIHAGAFFGDSLPALGKTGNYVLAFEPVYESFWCACKTLELTFPDEHSVHDVHLFNYGLGEEAGILSIITKDPIGRSMGGRPKYDMKGDELPESRLEETRVVTLDSMVVAEGRRFDEFSIVHLDVEEHEEKALKGAMEIIKASKPILILECWDDRYMNTPFYHEVIYSMGYVRGEEIGEDNVVLRWVG